MKLLVDDPRDKLTVNDSSEILKRFFFLQRELVVMQAGWIPGTAEMDVKMQLSEALWQDALVAKELRERILELRYPERRLNADELAPVILWWRSLRNAPDSASFIQGLTKVLKPALREGMHCYLAAADPLDDSPSFRILKQAIQDIEDQATKWDSMIMPQPASSSWIEALAGSVPRVLEQFLSGGTPVILEFEGEKNGGQAFQISRKGARSAEFNRIHFAWPDRLEPERGAGEGLELQIRAAVHHANEVWATEMAAAVLFDLAEEAPHEFLEDAARWCYDESRHCRMGIARLERFGYSRKEIPMDSFSYDAGANLDPLARLGIIYYFETSYIHTKSERTKLFREYGDLLSSHDMDFDWADELIHTYYGNRWLKYFLEKKKDPRTLDSIKKEAEAAVIQIRAHASEMDVEITEAAYRATMNKARELTGQKGSKS